MMARRGRVYLDLQTDESPGLIAEFSVHGLKLLITQLERLRAVAELQVEELRAAGVEVEDGGEVVIDMEVN